MTNATKRAAQRDMIPTSADHLARLIVCALLVGGGLFVAINHQLAGKSWERNDLIVTFGMIGGGLLVAFTRTILTAAGVLLPWLRKNGNDGPPPPAEA